MPPVRSYSEWIHRVHTLQDQQLRSEKPLDDLRAFVVQQWEALFSTFRHDKKLVEKYKKTVHLDPMEFDASVLTRVEALIKKRIERLHKVRLDIPHTTKNVWGAFSKKFQRLEQEEKFYLEIAQRVKEEIQEPLSRMRYQLALYQTMGIEQQLAKRRVKRL